MKRQRTTVAAVLIAGPLLAFAPFAVATAEAQQATDPRVADLVRAGKLRVGLFLPQYGKGPAGLSPTVWVETARAYAARIGIPLAIESMRRRRKPSPASRPAPATNCFCRSTPGRRRRLLESVFHLTIR